jgi:hypothetical protein
VGFMEEDEKGINVSADRVSPNWTALRPEDTANSSEMGKSPSILCRVVRRI